MLLPGPIRERLGNVRLGHIHRFAQRQVLALALAQKASDMTRPAGGPLTTAFS